MFDIALGPPKPLLQACRGIGRRNTSGKGHLGQKIA
jgi:hypothetical protein